MHMFWLEVACLGQKIPGKNVLKININGLLILTNVFTIARRRLTEIDQINFVISFDFISYLTS